MFDQGISSQIKTGFRAVESQVLISEDLLHSQMGFGVIFYCFATVCRFECCFTGWVFSKKAGWSIWIYVASFPDSDSAHKLWASWDLLRHFYCPIPVALKCFRNTYKLKQRHLIFLIFFFNIRNIWDRFRFFFFTVSMYRWEKKEAKKKCSGKSIYTQTGAQPASTPQPWNSHRGFPITSHFISRAFLGGMSKLKAWRVKTET